ncbi:MAG: hypothetical protein J7623_23980 [Chitinophaga sp.]|uniref:hypothetical protein n=1 Tax=Chitinophaga sp. TaxID=1869181 RepID=UPI001B1AAEC2|nr:hypothetical protein [Chitinophaga sp.]MBO9731721.1 hypothetical protein [Chitinophaga sp.]
MQPDVDRRTLKNTILLWLVGSFFLFMTRQVPFNVLSSLMNVSLFGIYIIAFRTIATQVSIAPVPLKLLTILLTGLLFFDIFYSLMQQNELGAILRFFVILILLVYSFYLVLPSKAINIFLVIMCLQAVIITLFSIYLTLFFTETSYLPVRFYFQEMEWGDVYTYNSFFYVVQIRGNALLPFALFVAHFYTTKRNLLYRIILFIGSVVAGNFAYIIAMAVFYFIYFLRSNTASRLFHKIIILSIMIILLCVPVYIYYVQPILERKQQGSLDTRSDQAKVLMTDLTTSPANMIFGSGLGHTIEKVTYSRDYRGRLYYELQPLYILNQLGILGFALMSLFLFVLMPLYRFRNKWILFIYFCYILYSSTNPYIFDSNHIGVILILIALQQAIQKKDAMLQIAETHKI